MRFGIQHFGNHQAPAPGWMVHQQPSANPEGFFFQAVARGDRFFMESMIQNGINVNARAVTGNTPAIIAAEYCQIDADVLMKKTPIVSPHGRCPRRPEHGQQLWFHSNACIGTTRSLQCDRSCWNFLRCSCEWAMCGWCNSTSPRCYEWPRGSLPGSCGETSC